MTDDTAKKDSEMSSLSFWKAQLMSLVRQKVKTEEQDGKMSLAAENDDRTTMQLTMSQRENFIGEMRVCEDLRQQQLDSIHL